MNRRDLIKSLAIGIIVPDIMLETTSGFSSGPAYRAAKATLKKYNELIWFKEPGKFWNSQSMHIGNGALGLSFLGGIGEEKFAITEKSLWTGGPGEYEEYRYGIKPGAVSHLAKIRELILSNEIQNLKLADQLNREHFLGDGKGYGHFSAFGHMKIVFSHGEKNVKNYSRNLDLSKSIANVNYEIDGVEYKREYFCSFPDKVAVLNFASAHNKVLSFKLKWAVFQKDYEISFKDNVFCLSGKINGNHRGFCLKMMVKYTSGKVYLKNNELIIENTDAINFIISANTSYSSVAPLYKGLHPGNRCDEQLEALKDKSISALRKKHIQDYQRLYNRVKLNIPIKEKQKHLPTNERWKNYALIGEDPGLKLLYFNLSRYLLISSSRPGTLPANLQGGWNMFETAQWSGNYQSNINVQLNYNGACSVDLLECQEPYIEWIKGLVGPGEEVARAYYGTKGWVSHSIGNIWGYAAPGFELEWGIYPAGASWHCHYIWKHFSFSQDKKYLADTAYPVLKGASLFWLENLISYKGRFISAPSGSAEHGAIIKNGGLLAIGSSLGQDVLNIPCNFQDIQMVRELFENTINASELLAIEPDFRNRLKLAVSQLMPLKIGRYGQLQEWDADIDSPDCNHRHIAHLYAVWPSKEIGAEDKELAAAAKKTLNMRGRVRNYTDEAHKDVNTAANWSLALRMACWLRLRDAEMANNIFTQLITESGFENLMTFQHVPAQAHIPSDLETFNAGGQKWLPVWQIDASLAISGLIGEMLLQTNKNNELILLPALPQEWPEGSITGLKAVGGLSVNVHWKNSRVTSFSVYSNSDKTIKVISNGKFMLIKTKPLNR